MKNPGCKTCVNYRRYGQSTGCWAKENQGTKEHFSRDVIYLKKTPKEINKDRLCEMFEPIDDKEKAVKNRLKKVLYYTIKYSLFIGLMMLMQLVLKVKNYGIWAGVFAVFGAWSSDVYHIFIRKE